MATGEIGYADPSAGRRQCVVHSQPQCYVNISYSFHVNVQQLVFHYYPLPRRRGPKGGHLGALAYGRSVRHEQGQEQASRREGGCGGGA